METALDTCSTHTIKTQTHSVMCQRARALLEGLINFVLARAGKARRFVDQPVDVTLGIAHVELACAQAKLTLIQFQFENARACNSPPLFFSRPVTSYCPGPGSCLDRVSIHSRSVLGLDRLNLPPVGFGSGTCAAGREGAGARGCCRRNAQGDSLQGQVFGRRGRCATRRRSCSCQC